MNETSWIVQQQINPCNQSNSLMKSANRLQWLKHDDSEQQLDGGYDSVGYYPSANMWQLHWQKAHFEA